MKLSKLFFVIILLSMCSLVVTAQEKEDMTKEEWQNEINSLTAKKDSLNKTMLSLKTDIANLNQTDKGLQSYDDCINDVYSMLGATKNDVDNFRSELNGLASKIGGKEPEKNDKQTELDAMKKNKISALPEFFDKVHNQLQRELDAWIVVPPEVNYAVIKGDCLWNIAKKKEFYANGFAWPIIYKSNRDEIKDPNLIFPKQIFRIPNLSDEEIDKYNKIRKNYKPAPPSQSMAKSN